MPSPSCHLPNGQTFTVTPVFGGVSFKSNDMNFHHSAFPPGWTIVINTRRRERRKSENGQDVEEEEFVSFSEPTLRDDCLYISYMVDPPSSDFKPASSPSRQVAMMLWATLWWYFHEPEPDLHICTPKSLDTPPAGRPKADWRVNIRHEGILKGRKMMQKLERMGLVASEESSVGVDAVVDAGEWTNMFVSRRSFWQLDPRIFLFTLSPKIPSSVSASLPLSPVPSATTGRAMPSAGTEKGVGAAGSGGGGASSDDDGGGDESAMTAGESTLFRATGGPFTSGSHLPTYFPPPPPQYLQTPHGIRHPIRPKPPRQGQVFYIRYIPSVDQYLSFRVPFMRPPQPETPPQTGIALTNAQRTESIANSIERKLFAGQPSDAELLHRWMNDPRVAAAWNMAGPQDRQDEFLRRSLLSRHSFPIIGCWNGRPFGYFEVYWVKEDVLGRALGGNGVDDYDRGIHVLVGEQEFRGPHRVAIWLSALVHYCWLADIRTRAIYFEPRVDNER